MQDAFYVAAWKSKIVFDKKLFNMECSNYNEPVWRYLS